jgi:hypothetical protein
MNFVNRLSSCLPDELLGRIQDVQTFWNEFRSKAANTEETPNRVLEAMLEEVEDVFNREPIDFNLLEQLTAKAALILTGKHYF